MQAQQPMRLHDDPVTQTTDEASTNKPASSSATTSTTSPNISSQPAAGTESVQPRSRKRKMSPSTKQDALPPPPGPPTHPFPIHGMPNLLPPPHALMHPGPHAHIIYGYPPQMHPGGPDFSTGGAPPPMIPPQPPQPTANDSMSHSPDDGDHDDPSKNGGRILSTNKRAEQNRKAQRAFRERREQHVKLLQSRSELLETALQSADEANRRWEECRVLVEQLRAENAAIRGENASLRQALVNARLLPAGTPNGASPAPMGNGVGGVGDFEGSQDRKGDPDAGKVEGNNAEPATAKA